MRATIDKVELPTSEEVQNMMTKVNEAKQTLSGQAPTSSSASPSPTGAGGSGAGMLASQFQTIKEVLEQGIRRITLRVEWMEGRKVQSVVVSYYVTDPRKVDAAINLSIPTGVGGATAPPTGSAGTSGSATTPKTGTTK